MRFVVVTICFLLAAACDAESPGAPGESQSDRLVQWALPDQLREISGLALTADERLLAVADEQAVIYELDYTTGRLVKSFAVGSPAIRDDFEGIAVLDGTIWIMSSAGLLYALAEGANGTHVAYERVDPGLQGECELEGLAEHAARGTLLMLCKESMRDNVGLRVFEWRPGGSPAEKAIAYVLPESAMMQAIDSKRIRPSGLSVDTSSGDWIVVAAGQHAIFRLSGDGAFRDVIMRLDPKRHRQAEGIATTMDGRLLIADEGGGGPARLAVYAAGWQDNGNNKN